MTLLPCILDKTEPFLRILDDHARKGDVFSLDTLTTNLTFDIIGAVVMDTEFEAQKDQQSEFLRLYQELVSSYHQNGNPVLPGWIFLRRKWRRNRLARKVDALLKDMIRKKHVEHSRSLSLKNQKPRSVLDLSFQDIPEQELTEDMLQTAADQIKTFLFAGHDTTSILLGWMCYDLSRTPHALRAVRAELDSLFGPDPDPAIVREKLLSEEGPDILNSMSYASAVIKESLRLHPPAGTARMAPPGSGFTVRTPGPDGKEVCLDGLVIYQCHHIIQRDKSVYGETADDFVPERWLVDGSGGAELGADSAGTAATEGGIPPGAWRPFERGPRNCIGQALATIEARVILAVIARRYDFIKVGLGELEVDKELDEKGQYRTKSELYITRQVTTRSVDWMRMKVKRVA